VVGPDAARGLDEVGWEGLVHALDFDTDAHKLGDAVAGHLNSPNERGRRSCRRAYELSP